MRCAAKEEQQQAFFFLNQSLHSSPVMSVMFADRAFHTAEKERASAFSFSSFIWIFLVCFRDIFLGSLFSWCCFVFIFSIRSLWCVLSAFPDPGLLSVQYFSASAPSASPYHSTVHHQGAVPQPPPSCWTRWRGLQQQDLESKFSSTLQLQIPLHPQRALRRNRSFSSVPKTF